MKEHMRRMHRLISMVSSIVFLLVLSGGLQAEVPPADVVNAAEAGLSLFRSQESFPGGNPFGNLSADQLSSAVVGYGFQVYTVNPVRLGNDKESRFHDMVVPMGVWRFVVVTGDSPIALLTVANVDGRWSMVSVGGTGLAGEVSAVVGAWPEASGFTHRFIRVFQAKADFMEIRGGSESKGFVPFASARLALNLDTSNLRLNTLLHDSEVLGPLREIVFESISGDVERQESIDRGR